MRSIDQNLLTWEQRIKERIQSGMTIEEWCEKNNITKHRYYYWNRQIRENQNLDEEVIFADVTTNLLKPDNMREESAVRSDFQLFFKHIRITVPSEFNPRSLAELMRVLQEL